MTRDHQAQLERRSAYGFSCVVTALVLSVAVLSGLFNHVEQTIHWSLMPNLFFDTTPVVPWAEVLIVWALCLSPAVLDIESPLALIALGAGIGFAYYLILSLVLFTSEIALPIVSPLLSVVVTTISAGATSWHAERERRRGLEQLDATKQCFTDMLVHDLKTRMSSILMSLSALQSKLPSDDAAVGEMAATIHASAERMLLLTGNLLDIRRIEEGKLTLKRERTLLTSILIESIRDHSPAAALADVRLELVDEEHAHVDGDRAILTRVIANLIWNALQHAPAYSDIEVGVKRLTSTAEFYVANRGRAIATGEARHLFDAFVTGSVEPEDSRAASTGLGLTFCKLAVEAHGGAINLVSPWSSDDDGVRFEISLPLS